MVLIFAGAVISEILFWAVERIVSLEVESRFERRMDDNQKILQSGINLNLHLVRALGDFFSARKEVNREEFRLFVANILKSNPEIQALEWVPRVTRAERPAFEEKARKEGYPLFQVTEKKMDGTIIPAGQREEYFPIYFVEPRRGNEPAVGYDLASDETRLAALVKSRDLDLMVATAPLRPVQERSNRAAFWVFLPIYQGGPSLHSRADRREKLKGFVGGAFYAGEMAESILRKGASPSGLDIYIKDKGAGAGQRLLHFHPSRLLRRDSIRALDENEVFRGRYGIKTMRVADREWTLVYRPVPGTLSSPLDMAPWFFLGGGLLLTFLVVTMLYLSWDYSSQLSQVNEKLQNTYDELKQNQGILIQTEKLTTIGTMAAGVTHEILNPVNVIGLHAQRLQWESKEGSDAAKSAEVICRSVQRISDICQNFRQFSRGESVSRAGFDPNVVVRDTIPLVQYAFRGMGVEVDLRLTEDSLVVEGNKNQLNQVFVNLLNNARDAMPSGGRVSILSRKVEAEGKSWWEARVTDTGPGIPKEIIGRIFDPFFTTKPKEKGTGLGLFVSHGIIHNHGGIILAINEPGNGATFIVRLPVKAEKAKERESSQGVANSSV